MIDDPTLWQNPDTAPTDGSEFLAELSNGWVAILYGTSSVRRKARYSWWGGNIRYLHIPYEPSHPKDTNWDETTPRLTGWQPLPRSRQEIKNESQD